MYRLCHIAHKGFDVGHGGGAIIKLFAQYGPAAVPHIEAFVRDMAQAVHNNA